MSTHFKRVKNLSEVANCFACGSKIIFKDGYILWFGSSGRTISLHRDCAEKLATGLSFDSIKLKYESRDSIIPHSKKET